jgi:hypothetical protein
MNATPVTILIEVHLGQDICNPETIGTDLGVGGDLELSKITWFHEAAL